MIFSIWETIVSVKHCIAEKVQSPLPSDWCLVSDHDILVVSSQIVKYLSGLSRQDKVKTFQSFLIKIFNYYLLAAARSQYPQTGDKVKANFGRGVPTHCLVYCVLLFLCWRSNEFYGSFFHCSLSLSPPLSLYCLLPAWGAAWCWWLCEMEGGPFRPCRPCSSRGSRQARDAPGPALSSSVWEPQPFSLPPTSASPGTWEERFVSNNQGWRKEDKVHLFFLSCILLAV